MIFKGAVFGDNNVILPSLRQQHDVIPFEYDEITPPCDDLGGAGVLYLINGKFSMPASPLFGFN